MTLYINDDATVWVRRPQESGPLVVLMHGMGSNEDDLAGLAPFLPQEYGVVSLRAPLGFMGGYAWFHPTQTPAHPDPAQVQDAAEAVLAWLDANVAPTTPVALMGFSQGGAMVSQLLRSRPERFIAGVMMSGFVSAAALPTDDAFKAAQLPIFIGRGDVDPVIPMDSFEFASDWLHERSLLTEVVYNGMAHGICEPEMTNIAHFLEYAISDDNDRFAAFLASQGN
ncbi:alpha/beta hydrolase [Timonella senegalensis]|uniref:alpha/beta hydrolase n=1 Tax=Timonella senegalensis TaxID=1465825 RepID=UPI0028AA80EC|nr:alpha/beta fold hydrolase [Timonella senegalensis]